MAEEKDKEYLIPLNGPRMGTQEYFEAQEYFNLIFNAKVDSKNKA